MMNMTFTVNGSSAVSWNLAVAGQCELADGNGDVISDAVFTSGSVTATGPQITTQPAGSLTLNAGSSGSLSVVASGATGYQWQVSTGGGTFTNLTNGSGYSGVTTSTLGIVATAGMNGNQYRVLVSGGGCPDVASSASTLTVVTCPSQVEINGPQNLCFGNTVTFTSTSAGGTWSSSNGSVAMVNPTNGVVTAMSSGTATITYTITGPSGCPNVSASINIVVNSNNATTVSQSICAPNAYFFNGQGYNTSGIYTATLTNAAGCDSVVTLNLTVNQPSASTMSETICSGSTFSFNGQILTATGIYTATLTNSAGCDSIVTLNLTVTPQPQQPTLACYESASFNTTTCQWDVTGTQPQQPSLACYESASFNTTTCQW
ncbi:MAG: hypothetical protein EBX72_12385, partial [Betaproteobacteria bacterium]|nr:hypothetical protein [Betaproteobacteria bacterium]